jgi:hypothetical protein
MEQLESDSEIHQEEVAEHSAAEVNPNWEQWNEVEMKSLHSPSMQTMDPL